MYLKYLVDENGHFLLFDPNINHNIAAKCLGKIVGAGMAMIIKDKNNNPVIKCNGESTTLGIASRKNVDEFIINTYLEKATF